MKKYKLTSLSQQLRFITIICFFCFVYSISITAKEAPFTIFNLCQIPLKCEKEEPAIDYLTFNDYLNFKIANLNPFKNNGDNTKNSTKMFSRKVKKF